MLTTSQRGNSSSGRDTSARLSLDRTKPGPTLLGWMTGTEESAGKSARSVKSGSAGPASLHVQTGESRQSHCPPNERVAAKQMPSAQTMQDAFGEDGPDLFSEKRVPTTGELPSIPPLKVADALLRPKMPPQHIAKGPKQGVTESRFKRWLVTMNGTENEIDDVHQHLLEEWPALCAYILIAMGKTAAGRDHMHVFLYLKERLSPKKIMNTWPWIHRCNFKPVGEKTTYNVVQHVKKQGNLEEYGATKLASHGRPPDGPHKCPSMREAVREAILDIAHDRLEPSEVMERDVNLWMHRGDDILCMAQELKMNLKRKTFEQPPLMEWQERAEHLLLNQSECQILFIVDRIGNRGKTWFAQYMHRKHGAIIFDQSDQRHCSLMWKMEKIVIFDVPRSAVPSYACMEAFKNGYVISEKYRSQQKYQDGMKVAVLMNRTPSMSQLSQDRYRIFDLLQYHTGHRTFSQPLQKTIEESFQPKDPHPMVPPKAPHKSAASSLASHMGRIGIDQSSTVRKLDFDEESTTSQALDDARIKVTEFLTAHGRPGARALMDTITLMNEIIADNDAVVPPVIDSKDLRRRARKPLLDSPPQLPQPTLASLAKDLVDSVKELDPPPPHRYPAKGSVFCDHITTQARGSRAR